MVRGGIQRGGRGQQVKRSDVCVCDSVMGRQGAEGGWEVKGEFFHEVQEESAVVGLRENCMWASAPNMRTNMGFMGGWSRLETDVKISYQDWDYCLREREPVRSERVPKMCFASEILGGVCDHTGSIGRMEKDGAWLRPKLEEG